MLEHQKIILQNVIDYPALFLKELEKSQRWLSQKDWLALQDWLVDNFMDKYPNLINQFTNPMELAG